MTVTVLGYMILISRNFYDFISPIHQLLKTVFDHISKHLEVCQKHCTVRRIFSSLQAV